MPKRTITITIIIIIGSAGLAALIWYLIFGSVPKQVTQPTQSAIPLQAPGKIQLLSFTPALLATINTSQNKISWYDQSGQFWASALDGSGAKPASQAAIQNLVKSIWSPDGSKNVIEVGTSQKDIRFVALDPTSNISTFLPNYTSAASFSPDGKTLIYQVIDDSKNLNSLYTSDASGKKPKTISALKLRDVLISWPQANLVSFVSKPTGLAGGSLWVFNLKTLTFDKLIDNLNGLEVLWSSDGNKILFSSTDANGQNPRLGMTDLKGDAKDLGISTITSKCAWASNSRDVYCAIPQNWQQGTILPDDYYQNNFSTSDTIVKVNTDTGQKDIMASGVTDATNLTVSQNQDFLILIMKNTGQLYRFSLK